MRPPGTAYCDSERDRWGDSGNHLNAVPRRVSQAPCSWIPRMRKDWGGVVGPWGCGVSGLVGPAVSVSVSSSSALKGMARLSQISTLKSGGAMYNYGKDEFVLCRRFVRSCNKYWDEQGLSILGMLN